jgi:hypothetical protein
MIFGVNDFDGVEKKVSGRKFGTSLLTESVDGLTLEFVWGWEGS